MQKRIEWIDISKAIGIISIVFGHICTTYYYPIFIRIGSAMSLYFVTIFFFIGGYLYKTDDIKAYTQKKMLQLLIPYISSFVIIMFIKKNEGLSILQYMTSLIYGIKGIDISTTPLWFLPCYFLSLIIFNVINQKFSFKTMCIICILSYIIYNIIYGIYGTIRLPWSINILPLTIFFIFIGYLSKIYFEQKKILLIYILGSVAMLSSIVIKNNTFDLFKNDIGIPFITTGCSILVIITINYISKVLSKTFVAKGLSRIGKSSIIIMVFHMPIYFILKRLFDLPFATYFSIIIWTIIVTLIGLSLYYLLDKFKITRILFLGKN